MIPRLRLSADSALNLFQAAISEARPGSLTGYPADSSPSIGGGPRPYCRVKCHRHHLKGAPGLCWKQAHPALTCTGAAAALGSSKKVSDNSCTNFTFMLPSPYARGLTEFPNDLFGPIYQPGEDEVACSAITASSPMPPASQATRRLFILRQNHRDTRAE